MATVTTVQYSLNRGARLNPSGGSPAITEATGAAAGASDLEINVKAGVDRSELLKLLEETQKKIRQSPNF